MERIHKTCFLFLIIVLNFIFVAWPQGSVYAQQKQQKRTNVDFEDQLVQGDVKKPELFYLLQKKQFNFGKLIKMRENFIPEMSKTSEDLEKTR